MSPKHRPNWNHLRTMIPVLSEKHIDQNSELLENVSSEPESKGSEIKTPSLDQDPNDGSIEEIDDREEGGSDVEGDDVDEQTQIESEADDAEEQTDDLAEGKIIETSSRKISALKVAVSAVVIAAVFAGFFVFDNKAEIKANSEEASKTSENRADFSKQTEKK